MKHTRYHVTWMAAAFAVFVAVAPASAEFPDHPITAVVPFDVGGATDILARLMAAAMSKSLGQPIIVQNKPGAGAILGTQFVVNAKPDGYTILFSGTAATETPAMYRKLPFDPLRDVVPVSMFAEAPFVVTVNSARVPAKNLQEFISLLRQKPGMLNAASGGTGTTLSVQLFLLKNDLSASIVPYKSAGAAITSMLVGETDFSIVDAAPIVANVNGGKLRALAVAGHKRLDILPDVPTAEEAGLANYTDTGPSGVYARAGTPPDILQKLHSAADAALSDPELIERFRTLGWTPTRLSLEENAARYRAQIAQWKETVARAKIAPLD